MLEFYDNWKLLSNFFKRPFYSYHLRELCRVLEWSPTKVRSIINKLKREELIQEKKEKNLSIFQASKSEKFYKLKILYNLTIAFKIFQELKRQLQVYDAIILFGSAARGEDSENSDFDIAVTGRKEIPVTLEKIEKEIERKISILFIENLDEIKEKNPHLFNNLVNGIVIEGYLKVL